MIAEGSMLIVCPECAARYEVAELALPLQGREVECSACGHVWVHRPGAVAAAIAAPPEPELRDEAPEAQADEGDFALSPLEARLPAEMIALLREEAAREIEARAQGALTRRLSSAAEIPPQTGTVVPDEMHDSPAEVGAAPLPAADETAAEPDAIAAPRPAPAASAPEAEDIPAAPPAPRWPRDASDGPLWRPAPVGAPAPPGGLALVGALLLLGLSLAALIYVGAPVVGREVPSLAPILGVYVDAADWVLGRRAGLLPDLGG
jgi:predicted Zn finger-like uncharacterized protein